MSTQLRGTALSCLGLTSGSGTLTMELSSTSVIENTHLPDITGLPEIAGESSRALDAFLAGVERKAFRIAQIALCHEADALDAVQDAMLRLSASYASRPPQEWPPLFYRILENRIRDFQRHATVRKRFMAILPWTRDDEDTHADPVELAVDQAPLPLAQLESDEAMMTLEHALNVLPRRQRQAFLLRNFEGLDVAATALAMQCSEGSVKTHYFRAMQALRVNLGEHRP